MTVFKPSRQSIEVALLLAVSLMVGLLAMYTVKWQVENNFKIKLQENANLQAKEISEATVNGQVMGAVATLGLINQSIKSVAKGELPLDDPTVADALAAVGNQFENTTGVYMVMPEGVIGSNWFPPGGKPLTGSVVKFRPYFIMAKEGKSNVYAAIGTTTGVPAFYFAAPLYSESSHDSPIIGATVVRINMNPIQKVLDSWSYGPSLLLSPQSITFLSNHEELNTLISKEPSEKELKAIKALKQFGSNFEKGSPKVLPFDIEKDVVIWKEQRYATARAPVTWDDPLGSWTLLLMGNLDAQLPWKSKWMIGASGFFCTFLLGWMGLIFRHRLVSARQDRLHAMNELQSHNLKLAEESKFKQYLQNLTNDLHVATHHTDFAQRLIRSVVPRIQADYLALYIPDTDPNWLIPLVGYGVRQEHLPRVQLGQGLVGQCAKNQEPIQYQANKDVPLTIVWGQGQAKPQSLLFLPLVQLKELTGVWVLASVKGFNPETLHEIDQLTAVVSLQLGILNRHTHRPNQDPAL